MTHNGILLKALSELDPEDAIYFLDEQGDVNPLSINCCGVGNTLVLLKAENKKNIATAGSLLNRLENNEYLEGAEPNPDFGVAISQLVEWDGNEDGFGSVRAVQRIERLLAAIIIHTCNFSGIF